MKRLVAIGGGELRNFTTLQIDTFISDLVKDPDKRTYALFIPTASHDSKPYFNTFRKTYTSKLGCKVDVAISTKGEMTMEHIKEKIDKADVIYVGGGDTVFMLKKWKETGVDKLILDAYNRGVILSGLSAGAICWFEKMYSDGLIMSGESSDYAFMPALGYLKGGACPHFNEREKDFMNSKSEIKVGDWFCIENNSAIVFKNGEFETCLNEDGKSYKITFSGENYQKKPL